MLPAIIPVLGRSKLELGLLELGVASSTCVPDFQDFNATVPVMIKDANRVILSNEIDCSVSSPNKLAVIRESFDVQCGKIHVFAENEHADIAG